MTLPTPNDKNLAASLRLVFQILVVTGFAAITQSREGQAKSPLKPQRIASCSLATDEMTLAILAAAHRENRCIALSTAASHQDYSNVVQESRSIAGRCGAELESLLALKPDLVLLAPYTRPEFIGQVEKAKIPAFVTENPSSLDQVEKSIARLGQILGESEATQQVLNHMRQRRKALFSRRPVHKTPRLLHIFKDGAASGADTMFDAIAKEVGATNIAAEMGLKGWPKLSIEFIATLKPDFIVMGDDENQRGKVLDNLRSLPGFREIPAVKEGRLILIPEKSLGSVAQYVMDAVESLAKELDRSNQSLPPPPQN